MSSAMITMTLGLAAPRNSKLEILNTKVRERRCFMKCCCCKGYVMRGGERARAIVFTKNFRVLREPCN